MLDLTVAETGEFTDEVDAHFAGFAVAVFGDVDDGESLVLAFRVGGVARWTAQQEYDVGILFDGAGVAKVGKLGLFKLVAALFVGSRQLRKNDNRNF